MVMCEKLWKDVAILYKKLQAYIRKRLRDYYAKHYPAYKFPTDGSIPAHLLGTFSKLIEAAKHKRILRSTVY